MQAGPAFPQFPELLQGGRMAGMATKDVVIRDYRAEDAPEIVRLFFETVRSVNLVDYSGEQVEA